MKWKICSAARCNCGKKRSRISLRVAHVEWVLRFERSHRLSVPIDNRHGDGVEPAFQFFVNDGKPLAPIFVLGVRGIRCAVVRDRPAAGAQTSVETRAVLGCRLEFAVAERVQRSFDRVDNKFEIRVRDTVGRKYIDAAADRAEQDAVPNEIAVELRRHIGEIAAIRRTNIECRDRADLPHVLDISACRKSRPQRT